MIVYRWFASHKRAAKLGQIHACVHSIATSTLNIGRESIHVDYIPKSQSVPQPSRKLWRRLLGSSMKMPWMKESILHERLRYTTFLMPRSCSAVDMQVGLTRNSWKNYKNWIASLIDIPSVGYMVCHCSRLKPSYGCTSISVQREGQE